jgi:hypothetical protein
MFLVAIQALLLLVMISVTISSWIMLFVILNHETLMWEILESLVTITAKEKQRQIEYYKKTSDALKIAIRVPFFVLPSITTTMLLLQGLIIWLMYFKS